MHRISEFIFIMLVLLLKSFINEFMHMPIGRIDKRVDRQTFITRQHAPTRQKTFLNFMHQISNRAVTRRKMIHGGARGLCQRWHIIYFPTKTLVRFRQNLDALYFRFQHALDAHTCLDTFYLLDL